MDLPVTRALVTSPAEAARGHVRISDEGTVRWECLLASPGSAAVGLAPLDIARAIAAALAEYRTAGHDEARDSPHGEAAW